MLVGISRLIALAFLVGGLAFAGDDAKTLAKKLNAARMSQDLPAMLDLGKQLLAVDPKNTIAMDAVGIALHTDGKYDEALVYHKMLAESGSKEASTGAYNAACAYALKGDTESSFSWLEKSVKLGFKDVGQLKKDDDLKSLRADPRFKQIAEAMAEPAPAKETTGGDDAKKQDENLFIGAQSKDRKGTRAFAFGNGWTKQVAIDYGPVMWKDAYEAKINGGEFDGKRWRTGSDFWTHLDASAPFTLGDKSFEIGDYYLVTERSKEGSYSLIVLNASDVRKAKLDAFFAADSTGGVEVPMKHETIDKEDELGIELSTESKKSTKGSLKIEFGTHRLSVPFELKI